MPSSQLKPVFSFKADQASSIQDMFNAVAPRYDFLNRLLSVGFDKYWRTIAVDELEPLANRLFLDLATGTADIALELALRDQSHVIGIDFSGKMLELGKNKVKTNNMQSSVKLFQGAAENIPIKSNSFDGAISAFGARNFSNINHAITEVHRVLKPKGKAIIQIPLNKKKKISYENYDITDPKERSFHFGQYDHVRIYGMDFFERLSSVGFKYEKVDFTSTLTDEEIIKYGLIKGELIPVGWK